MKEKELQEYYKKTDSAMEKYFATFGSGQLRELRGKVNPMKVALVIEGRDEIEAREKVFGSFVGREFCTTYPIDKLTDDFQTYTIEELEKMID